MTRGEIWKDFFKRTVLPAVIALFLFFMFKNGVRLVGSEMCIRDRRYSLWYSPYVRMACTAWV